MKVFRLTFWFLLFVVSFSTAYGLTPIALTDELDIVNPANYMEYLEDEDQTLSFQDVLSPSFANKFKVLGTDEPRFGHSDSAFWLRFEIGKPAEEQHDWLLTIDSYWLDDIQIFIIDENSKVHQKQAGYRFPFSQREIIHNTFAFSLPPLSSIHRIYVRVADSRYHLSVPLNLKRTKYFIAKAEIERLFMGIFIGMMIFLAIQSLIFYYLERNLPYLFYTFWIVAACLLILQLFGLTYQYFWPEWPWLEHRAYKIFISATNLMMLLFGYHFLKLKDHLPFWSVVFQALKIAAVALLVISFSGFWISGIDVWLTLVVATAMTVVTIWRARQGYRPALYIAISFWFFDYCLIDGLVRNLLFSSPVNYSLMAFAFAFAVQTVLFTIAIQSQFRNTQKERRNAAQEMTEQLEAAVKDKTIELGMVNEILLEAKKEAEAANIAKSEFLANISHELRNPMHQILAYSKFGIKKTEAPREKLVYYLGQVRKSAKRLKLLLDDLLDLSKMESGKMNYEMVENNINELIEETISEVQESLEERDLSVVVKHSYSPPPFVFDYLRLGQVIRNLLDNAIKYSPRGKEIDIHIGLDEASTGVNNSKPIRISISDQGPGIPDTELRSIFEKFSQSSYTKTGAGGTGLGLAICLDIVGAHGGEIWAENNPKGGATFVIMIPETIHISDYNPTF